MQKMSHVKRMTITAMCIALCYVIIQPFRGTELNQLISPMHFPVLLCGLICGGGYGAICGIVGPLLASISGAPPMIMALRMIPELAVYGLVTGLLMQLLRTGHTSLDLYISLVAAMILGRIAGGITTAVYYGYTAQVYSVGLWATGYFVGTAPGAVIQLLILPGLVMTLQKAKLIPTRYVKAAKA